MVLLMFPLFRQKECIGIQDYLMQDEQIKYVAEFKEPNEVDKSEQDHFSLLM